MSLVLDFRALTSTPPLLVNIFLRPAEGSVSAVSCEPSYPLRCSLTITSVRQNIHVLTSDLVKSLLLLFTTPRYSLRRQLVLFPLLQQSHRRSLHMSVRSQSRAKTSRSQTKRSSVHVKDDNLSRSLSGAALSPPRERPTIGETMLNTAKVLLPNQHGLAH